MMWFDLQVLYSSDIYFLYDFVGSFLFDGVFRDVFSGTTLVHESISWCMDLSSKVRELQVETQ